MNIESLMSMIDGGGESKKGGLESRIMNPKLRQKMIAEQKKRQRELLKRKMEAGIDLLGEDNEIKLEERLSSMGFFERLFARIGQFIESLKPFKSDINFIKANFDMSISQFFEIIQYVFVLNLMTAIAYSPLIIRQLVVTQNYPP